MLINVSHDINFIFLLYNSLKDRYKLYFIKIISLKNYINIIDKKGQKRKKKTIRPRDIDTIDYYFLLFIRYNFYKIARRFQYLY